MNLAPLLLGIGVLTLCVAWLPQLLDRVPLTLPLFCVGLGAGLEFTGVLAIEFETLFAGSDFELLTDLALIVALLGAGLKIDRPLGWRRWNTPWRLIGIGMPVMALCVGLAGIWQGYPVAIALFLAGALSPTDPVLASTVAVGPPGSGEEGEVRFGLSGEAGINDGLAFPIVLAGLTLASGDALDGGWIGANLILRVALSIALGWGIGRLLGWLTFGVSHFPLTGAASGLVALGVALSAYAATELASGYGFIAVFMTALALRESCPSDPFHKSMTDFIEQIERIAIMFVLIAFGAIVASGEFSMLGWQDAALAAALLFVARPASVLLAMIGSPLPMRGRLVLAFFGIRGVATLYYLAFASDVLIPQFENAHALATLMVFMSLVVHGLAARPLMSWLDHVREASLKNGEHPDLIALSEGTFANREEQNLRKEVSE
ncbi:hypothetical protein B2G71_21585 [Novosphingobium sp. PC22D]|uniref:cation:proton antiporter n=1 Tax=Novosphingobium sp. PC22D TaxID=1962403 RepID=UPI000BFABA79|nr:cation:proton antiporter [Novosphingobium sp. PC22D]PEQ10577.1 hypothetical protein B2G71_21585 [Novosphingobium sp. PC22D]